MMVCSWAAYLSERDRIGWTRSGGRSGASGISIISERRGAATGRKEVGPEAKSQSKGPSVRSERSIHLSSISNTTQSGAGSSSRSSQYGSSSSPASLAINPIIFFLSSMPFIRNRLRNDALRGFSLSPCSELSICRRLSNCT